MGVFHNLKLRFSPPRITDPDFGSLLFVFIPAAPEKSYWECEWKFPKTGTVISIGLPGGENGPSPEARRFYLSLPGRFEWIVAAARPELEDVFRTWLQQDLPHDVFTVVKLAGFGLEDANAQPVKWDISFETTGDKWLGIIIPFLNDVAQKAVVDSAGLRRPQGRRRSHHCCVATASVVFPGFGEVETGFGKRGRIIVQPHELPTCGWLFLFTRSETGRRIHHQVLAAFRSRRLSITCSAAMIM